MNVPILPLLLAIALVVPVAQSVADQSPEGTGEPSAAQPAAAEEAAPAPAAQSVVTPEMIREFRALREEIVQARKAIRQNEAITALNALKEAAAETNDLVAVHRISTDIHMKTEELLAAQPGMSEKLARFQELGETMRRGLAAEKRRKGKRLPKRADDEPSPAETAPAP